MPHPFSGIQPFSLTGSQTAKTPLIRGRLVRLFQPCHSILARHDYLDIVSAPCAEAMALAGCLASTLKFDGIFTVQAKGDAGMKTLFADVTSDGHIRSYAHYDEDKLNALQMEHPARLDKLMGSGYIAFTVDQKPEVSGDEGHRYQGIVELAGEGLAGCAMQWFKNSEQLATHVLTSAARTEQGWVAAALILQRIAQTGGITEEQPLSDAGSDSTDAIHDDEMSADDLWQTCTILADSVRQDELLDPELSSEALLFRLFHAHGVHVQPPQEMTDQCRCSDEKVEMMLAGLSAEQRLSVADEAGRLIVNCEFCKQTRSYHLTSFQD